MVVTGLRRMASVMGLTSVSRGFARTWMAPHAILAATVAGKTFGVAKKANVIAVRVLDDDGFGSEL